MRTPIKSYLVIPAHILFGLGIIVLVELVKMPSWLSSIVMFSAFLLLNIAQAYLLKLNKELKESWSLKKIPFILWGTVFGFLIAVTPILLQLIVGKLSFAQIQFNSQISFISICLTLFIVGWEELWFRGLFLNYCNKYIPAVHLSLIIGFLFMIIHLLNPEIKIIRQGPALFFAGAFLTLVYFYYKTIWLPIGLHFGNNFLGSKITAGDNKDLLFGEDGYMGALVLAALFFIFLFKMKKRNVLQAEVFKP
jgi:membrane protease YdiL (CAAX protease family)